ncbi:MAG TPA: hypothetical protein VK568_14585 [Thermodesulfobacteriota bacterium]|jgi:hypothetical protein|nr:hypothetical protein [Thermodesulfobacteriota bacterium]
MKSTKERVPHGYRRKVPSWRRVYYSGSIYRDFLAALFQFFLFLEPYYLSFDRRKK